jgi:antitoxin (DNA-binding transcriptional repressor) of toxin-antitoxin stability system
MRSISISVTEAARNFADCVNRARYQGTSFILHKNGVAVARIVPESRITNEQEPSGQMTSGASPAEPVASSGDFKEARKLSVPEIW